MRKGEQTVLKGLLSAIQTGDQSVLNMLSSAREQLFLNTATGLYLTSLANQYGFAVPPNSGLDGNGFRAVAIPAIWAPKQSISTINILAELFYSASVLHPSIQSTMLDPYPLVDGDTLIFDTEVDSFSVVFNASRFSDLNNISAAEVAATISAQSNGRVTTNIEVDRITGRYYVKVISKSFGSNARIRCRGGSAQNVIRFQTFYDNVVSSPVEWTITKFANASYSNTVRFTWSGVGVDPQLYSLDRGDFVTLRGLQDGSSPFSILNGTYELSDVGSDYFEFFNLAYSDTNVVFTQTDIYQIGFTKKDFRTLFQNSEYAIVSETSPGVIDVNIPTVPPIIRRPLIGALRLRGGVVNVIDYNVNQITVNYPNSLPDSGTLVYDSVRFSLGFDRRFYKYTSKNLPIGDTQVLNIDQNSDYGLPFFNPTQAATALSVIPGLNPIFVTVGESDIEVHTPPVKHNFEHAQEIVIQDVTIENNLFKHKTIPSILLPANSDTTVFEHNMDSNRLYIQFTDENTGEIFVLTYKPDSVDPINRTRIFYTPVNYNRFMRAVICEISPAPALNDVTATVGPIALSPSDEFANFAHNFGTQVATVIGVDPSTLQNYQGVRQTINGNTSRVYVIPDSLPNISSFNINHQDFFPNLVRVVAFNINLPASPSSFNTVTVVHNLFSAALIVELKVKNAGNTGLLEDSFLFQPKIITTTDTEFDIIYNGLQDDIIVDVYILASYLNPIESVNGGLLASQINNSHIVKQRINQHKYSFNIPGTGEAPLGLGTITTAGKVVTGVGTLFTQEVQLGNAIKIPNGQMRQVVEITNDTILKLSSGFSPSIGDPTIYKIVSEENNDISKGKLLTYEGTVIFGFNVDYFEDNVRGTNIRFVFPDRVSRQSAGFIDGTAVKILPEFGTDLDEAGAAILRKVTLTVNSQEGRYVYFQVPVFSPTPAVYIQGAKAARSGYFGGANFKHFIDLPLSNWNEEVWYKEPKLFLLDSDLAPNDFYAGSYIYDNIGNISPFIVGQESATLTRPISGFSAPGILEVSDVSKFPPSGNIFLDFGNDRFEGPIRYFVVIPGTPSILRIDPAYVFKNFHPSGSIVRLAASTSKVDLKTNGSQLPVYLTGSTEARKTLEFILRDLVSVGVKLNIIVDLPALKYYEESIPPFS